MELLFILQAYDSFPFSYTTCPLVLLASQINLISDKNIIQHCPVEFYVMMEMFFQTSKPNTAATSHMWLLSPGNVATAEKLSFGFYLILINFHLQSPPVLSGFCINGTAPGDRKLCDARLYPGELTATQLCWSNLLPSIPRKKWVAL